MWSNLEVSQQAQIQQDAPKGPQIQKITPEKIFNLPIYEGYLIIDCRQADFYLQEHIESAISFPAFQPGMSPQQLDLLLVKYLHALLENFPPERIDPITIYGDWSCEAHAQWLAQRLATLNQNPLPIPHTEEYLQSFANKLLNVKHINILEGGFETFKNEFPIQCVGTLHPENFQGIPLPCWIAPGLFLGSRPTGSLERRYLKQLAYEHPTLVKLGINCVIVNGDASLGVTDTLGLECILLDVPDKEDLQMDGFWRVATDVIESRRKLGQKVLLQVHGRSKSASFAIAWAMQTLQLSFEQAYLYVMSKVPYKLDQALMFLDQLQVFHPTKLLQ